MRPVAVLAIALIVLPGVSGAWNQMAGDAGHSAVALDLPPTMDVVSIYPYLREGEAVAAGYRSQHPGFLPTDHGLTAIKEMDGLCRIFHITDVRTGSFEQGPMFPCHEWTQVHAYDRVRDEMLTCAAGGRNTDDIWQGRKLDQSEPEWGVSASDMGILPYEDLNPSRTANNAALWECIGTVLDEEAGTAATLLYLGQQGKERAVGFDLEERTILWSTALQTSHFTGADEAAASDSGAPYQDFTPRSMTKTDSGYVIIGHMNHGTTYDLGARISEDSRVGAAMWLDLDGNVVGTALAEPVAVTSDGQAGAYQGNRGKSEWAAANGRLAAFFIGEDLLIVDPSTAEPLRSIRLAENEAPEDYFPASAAPAWWNDHLVVPRQHSAIKYDTTSYEPEWKWIGSTSDWVIQVLIAPPEDVYVLVGHPTDETYETDTGIDRGSTGHLLRLDINTGKVVQRTPIAMNVMKSTYQDLTTGDAEFLRIFTPMVAVDGGIALWHPSGDMAFLGESDPAARPEVSFSSRYPQPGEDVILSAQAADTESLIGYDVFWGAGVPESFAPGETATLQFSQPERQLIRVTAIYTDGRTATTTSVLDVGGRELNWIQEQFEPENQDMTWGVIGLVVVIIGAFATFGRRWRRRLRRRAELARLDSIRELSLTDAAAAAEELAAFRIDNRKAFQSGRIDEAEYGLIVGRITGLLKGMRYKLTRPFDHKLTADFQRLLDTAFQDEVLDPQEQRAINTALSKEKRLTTKERARVELLIDAWS